MTTAVYIKNIEITDLRSRYHCSITLKPGVNVFHGENGSFKTTFANIIALVASGDFRRVGYYEPSSITVSYSDSTTITADYRSENARTHKHFYCTITESDKDPVDLPYFCPRNDHFGFHGDDLDDFVYVNSGQVIYYPSFRLLIDNAKNSEEKRKRVVELLGFWLEALNKQTSLSEIISRLDSRYGEYLKTRDSISSTALDILLGTTDIEALPLEQREPFNRFQNRVSELVESTDDNKRRMLNEISNSIRDLKDEARTTEYKSLFALIDNINEFLKRKTLNVDSPTSTSGSDGLISLVIDDQRIDRDDIPKALSAGERQIVTLLHQFNECDSETTLIVDEPEISLDINWQQKLGTLLTKNEANQVIVFTHSAGFASRFQSDVIGKILIDGEKIGIKPGT